MGNFPPWTTFGCKKTYCFHLCGALIFHRKKPVSLSQSLRKMGFLVHASTLNTSGCCGGNNSKVTLVRKATRFTSCHYEMCLEMARKTWGSKTTTVLIMSFFVVFGCFYKRLPQWYLECGAYLIYEGQAVVNHRISF